MPARTSNPTYLKNRTKLLADHPLCHWCNKAPATTADHIIEHDRGGDDSLDNMVPACGPCNSKRGARYRNAKHAAKRQERPFFDANPLPPSPLAGISPREPARTSRDRRESAGTSPMVSGLPRLRTVPVGGDSFGASIVEWAKTHLSTDLMPWQKLFVDDVFRRGDDGKFVFRSAIASTGRQNGKTTLMEAIIGYLLTVYPFEVGRPVTVLSTAHELTLATESFHALADILEERFGAKVMRAYGRSSVTMPDGSLWKVSASSSKKHGGTWDFICADEIWSISEQAIFGALRPSQIAVPNPLMLMFSTAGDESSTVFTQLREQALASINDGKPTDLYYAEWSVPPGTDPGDETFWPMANPALGTTITIEGLRSAHNAPDKIQFMRAHLNQWVSAAGAWLEPGLWAKLQTDLPMPDGGVLAIETSIDDARFVGVRAVAQDENVHIKVEFVTDTEAAAWAEVERIMADHRVHLAVTPSLEIHLPPIANKRFTIVGYNELLKYTGLVRTMINEGRVLHRGETILAEHVNRAVPVKTVQGVVLSSQKSPGPIELCRCLIWAAAMVSRPQRSQRPLLVVATR